MLDVPCPPSLTSPNKLWITLIQNTSLIRNIQIFFPHIVPPSTNMFPGRQCITFSLSAFLFSLLTLFILCGFSHNAHSHHVQTFPPSLLVSLLCFFSLLPSRSLVFKMLAFLYPPLLFSLLSPWIDPSLSMCASLYVLCFDNPLEALSPIKSWLECSLPVSEGFAEGWGCWYVSHL